MPRDIAVRDGGAHPVMRRRIGQALAAPRTRPTIMVERALASRAPRGPEKAQAGPAGGAEAVIGRSHVAAAGAARRQRMGDERGKGSREAHARLVPQRASLHKRDVSDSQPAEIFDRALRRKRRDRAATLYRDHAFLRDEMLDGIHDRLAHVKREFRDVLDLGSFDGSFTLPGATITRLDAGAAFAAQSGAVHADEDLYPFPEASFDLVVSAGVLDTINDVPGTLALIRRALKPDGLFLGAFAGAGSLATLKAAFLAAEPVARFHPQIDVRSAGDLLGRAGFTLQVADTETLTVRYSSIWSLLKDLRGMAATNLLPGARPLTRGALLRAAEAFAAKADPDGRVPERFEIVYLTGWAPDPSQPKPARRGSGTTSLAAALKAAKDEG